MRFTYPPGSTPLDGFTIEQGLGVGGFGEVYRAVSDVGKHVALKKIQRNLDIELRGVRQCINLKHVNLISLWDIRTDAHGESWVVMEYVPGPSLRDIVHAHPNGLPEEEVKRWFVSTASGVAYLHQQDIVHRDLKPGNIFLDEETQVIKIGDYGLSKYMNASRRSGQTESVGTFHYMAPEIGRGVYGREIDIYALGIILFEILTGDVPFDGESTQEIVMKHLTDDPKLDRVPAGFRKAIRNAMQKDPELRYHSVPEMLADLPWPDIAENCQKIISVNAVGPLVNGNKTPRAIHHSEIDPLEITHDHLSVLNSNAPSRAQRDEFSFEFVRDEDVQIVDPVAGADIIFGPLKDLSQGGNSASVVRPVTESVNASSSNPSSRSNLPGTSQPGGRVVPSNSNSSSNGSPPTSGSGRAATLVRVPMKIDIDYASAPSSLDIDEPIARSVYQKIQDLENWWSKGNVSTSTKVVLLAVISLILVVNSAWLLPLALTLGLIYLCYYGARTWWIGDQTKLSKRAVKKIVLDDLRSRLQLRSTGQRIIELLGSIMVAILACGVLSLLGLAIGGSVFQPTRAVWQAYGWLTSTSAFACCLLLVISKFWEDRIGEAMMRRFTMIVAGVMIGAFSFLMANSFDINLSEVSQFGTIHSPDSKIVIKGMPILPAMLIHYVGLMGILRWWLLMDPIRSTRLSILGVSFGLIWACLFSLLLELPVLPNCILAVVISIAIQLAAPWWSLDEAKKAAKMDG
jgi:serine/threonine protein kinase